MLIPLSVSEQTTTTPAAPKKKGSCEQYPIKRQENEATKTRSFAMYGPKLTIVCRTLLLMCSNLFWSLCLLILLYYFVYSIRNNRFNSYISLSLLKMKIKKKYYFVFFIQQQVELEFTLELKIACENTDIRCSTTAGAAHIQLRTSEYIILLSYFPFPYWLGSNRRIHQRLNVTCRREREDTTTAYDTPFNSEFKINSSDSTRIK